MNSYCFALIFKFDKPNLNPDTYIEALGESCSDALIGVGKLGEISFDFTREGQSAFVAVKSAIQDIKKVIPEAKLIEAKPDYIGISDLAEMIGVKRQYVRKLILKENFPSPAHYGNPTLWHLSSILGEVEIIRNKVNGDLVDIAKVTRKLNVAREVSESPLDESYKQLI